MSLQQAERIVNSWLAVSGQLPVAKIRDAVNTVMKSDAAKWESKECARHLLHEILNG